MTGPVTHHRHSGPYHRHCYENRMDSLTSSNWSPTIFILLCGLHKAMVIPAKAGIQEGRGWEM